MIYKRNQFNYYFMITIMLFKSFVIVLLSAVAISQCADSSEEIQEFHSASPTNRQTRNNEHDYQSNNQNQGSTQNYYGQGYPVSDRKYGPRSQTQQNLEIPYPKQNGYQDYDYANTQVPPWQQNAKYQEQIMYSRPQKYNINQHSGYDEQEYNGQYPQKNSIYQPDSQEQIYGKSQQSSEYHQNYNRYQPQNPVIKQSSYDYQQYPNQVDYVNSRYNQYQQQNSQSPEEHSQDILSYYVQARRVSQEYPNQNQQNSQEQVGNVNNQYNRCHQQNSKIQQGSEENSQGQNSYYNQAKGISQRCWSPNQNSQEQVSGVNNQYNQSPSQQNSEEHFQEQNSYYGIQQHSQEIVNQHNQYQQENSETQQIPEGYFGQAKGKLQNYWSSGQNKHSSSQEQVDHINNQNNQYQQGSSPQNRNSHYGEAKRILNKYWQEDSSEGMYGGQQGQSYTQNHYNSQQTQQNQYDPNGSFEIKQVMKKAVKHSNHQISGQSVENQQGNREVNSSKGESNENQSYNQMNVISR
ncbi:hypothetical protein ILUMI_01039 [Ignelater luminosus]|uniref:Uncharacterized protein n=1 Tax=Ignelater luminosus TaxID=2038154 RepID=A0A8K0GMK8_IGNLU|nr:hypothetical protein ILUMI_01039 [Ignelater luminosus]